jgi:hypothetical protein
MINWPLLPGTLFPCGPPGTAGMQGPIGIQGSQGNLGPPGPVAWGLTTPWASSTAYTATPPSSTVFYSNNTYVCVVTHVSTGTFNPAYWQIIAAQGPTGPAGPIGGGTGFLPLQNITAGGTYTTTGANNVIINTTAAVTCQLPTSLSQAGAPVPIADISGAPNVTILPYSTETIVGGANLKLVTPYGGVTLWPLASPFAGGWYLK